MRPPLLFLIADPKQQTCLQINSPPRNTLTPAFCCTNVRINFSFLHSSAGICQNLRLRCKKHTEISFCIQNNSQQPPRQQHDRQRGSCAGIARLCSAPPAQHPGMAKAFPASEPAQVWQSDAGLLGTETRPGRSSTELLTGPHRFVLPVGNCAPSSHPGVPPASGRQTKEGRAALLLLQRLMKLLADVSRTERERAGHPHRSPCRVFSRALPEQLMGWENPNPPAATPASSGQNLWGTIFTAPHNPTAY